MRTTLRGLSAGVLALSVAIMAPSATAFAAGVGTEPAPEVLATLKVTSTKVEVRKAGAEKFKGARDGASLREGDTIRTDATGTAEVDYGNESYTRLDVNTTFTIKRLTEEQGSRQVQGSLEAGQAWHRAAAITESESFEQEGAGANATVLGTAFAVVCDAVDRCTFTAVVDNIQLTGKDGVVKLLTPLDQCESSDTTAGGEVRDLTGVLCGDVTKISPDDLPEWIYENLVKDRDELGIDDSGLLDGTFVIEDDGSVFFVPALPALPAPPPTTVPGPVRNVVAVAGNGFATVSFDPPLSDGGSPITGYTATATPGGGPLSVAAAPVSVSVSGPGSPIVVDPLVNGVSYTFTVIATNAIGGGPTSPPSPPVTPMAPGCFEAEGSVVFSGSPGTGAPPPSLGTCAMTAFGVDAASNFTPVSSVAAPGGGDVSFSTPLDKRTIGNGWATWSNGYTGAVYFLDGTGPVTLTMPSRTLAFYFYAEPNNFDLYAITATAWDGTTSGAVSVDGNAGAQYFGFAATSATNPLQSVEVTAPADAGGFAVGEFGISRAPEEEAPAPT